MHQQDQPPTHRRNAPGLCNHVFPPTPTAAERLCGSPALRGQSYCYYHHPTRTRVANPNERRARRLARQAFTVTIPTNRAEAVRAIGEIATRVATNQIDLRRARFLFSAIQNTARHLRD